MGTFTVPLEVADPLGRHYETVDAMVDSGATYTVLPAAILHRLGVVPRGTRRFVLADGSQVERGFSTTWMRLAGREELSPVVFWDEDARPLLGAVTLEIFSLGIDPVNGQLIPVDAFMLALGSSNIGNGGDRGSRISMIGCSSTRYFLPCTSRYSAGSTTSVSRVDETIPPMTTVASGR